MVEDDEDTVVDQLSEWDGAAELGPMIGEEAAAAELEALTKAAPRHVREAEPDQSEQDEDERQKTP